MRVSLVIPAYNEETLLPACLESVLANAPGAFAEIVVVDNASTDQTGAIAARYPGVRVVREERKGLPSARERGRLETSGDFIAYIDADTRLPVGWLAYAEHVFGSHSEAVSLSGPARYYDASLFEKVLLEVGWWLSAPLAYRMSGYMIYGAHFIVRRTALEAAGGFNKDIVFYGEDTDIARRLSRFGKTIFSMDFRINTSARRFLKEGIPHAMMTYAINFLWPALFKRPFTHTHRDVRS